MKRLLATLFFAFVVAASLPSFAANETNELSADQLTDQVVSSYAEAAEQVVSISKDYKSKLESIRSEEKAKALMAETQKEMAQAIEATGLTIEEYNAVFRQAREDKELQKKISNMLNE
ncbi:DUF4168 domain-containing protein [Salinivibrio sharmensis]|uniref:DUF4168 domain-containing protein n=1 Tax=Salinivibrio sharmensis TaxID=390883 RepID=A0ABX3KL70_9GAMM|nr:DUF4168 domain-containing protein [Salinivibrio sharmensis]OOE90872.1 hypothetical protein BZG74_01190 [Salinivibrio sharmensis]